MYKLKASNGSNNLCGKVIKILRSKYNLSQRKMTEKLQLAGYGIADNHFIRRIENGERFITDIELLMFSEFFHVEIAELFGDNIGVTA